MEDPEVGLLREEEGDQELLPTVPVVTGDLPRVVAEDLLQVVVEDHLMMVTTERTELGTVLTTGGDTVHHTTTGMFLTAPSLMMTLPDKCRHQPPLAADTDQSLHLVLLWTLLNVSHWMNVLK